MLMQWDWLNDQLRHTLNSLYYTPMGMVMRDVPGAHAVVDALHVLGTAMLLGAICVGDLRVIGFPHGVRAITVEALIPVGKAGWLITLVTGILLVCRSPDQYLFDATARWQVGFLMFAGMNLLLFHVPMVRRTSNPEGRYSLVVRLAAALALAACLGAITAGRLAAQS